MAKRGFANYTAENTHPGFSIDCVILSYYKGNMKVLLNEFWLEDYWVLPGGFMFNDEDSDSAAHRILKVNTGMDDVFLKQFYLFSNPERTIMEQNKEYVATHAQNGDDGQWLMQRFVSLGYYALVKYENVKLKKLEDKNFKWYNIQNLPRLYTDHQNIISTALNMIKTMLPLSYICYKFLPEKFTITELRKIHEIVLNTELDRRNFQRKILSDGDVIQLNETKKTKVYNPPILYSFDTKKIKVENVI